MWLKKIYAYNKELDKEFISKYQANERCEENLLSLLVEIGELANETRCFKYWSKKGSSEREVILAEYADVITMVLCFCNYLKVEDHEFDYLVSDLKERTIVQEFLELYSLVSELNQNYNKGYILNILSKVLVLGHHLGFTDEELEQGILKKMNIVEDRLHSNY